jgi:hypothetical protein
MSTAERIEYDRAYASAALADAGLLVGEKREWWVWWRVEPTRLASVRAALGG